MSRKLLSYDDAAKLLGGDSKAITVLDNLAGITLVGATFGGIPAAAGLFELKEEIVGLGQQVTKILRSRLGGLGRFSRSELLEAAHAVIVVSAFFGALDDLDADLGTMLNAASLEMTTAEQIAIATSSIPPGKAGLASIARGLVNAGTIPGLKAASVGPEPNLKGYYTWLAHSFASFAAGTAAWDMRDETTRERWQSAITKMLPKHALTRYEEHLTRLSVEFPEFAFMAHRVGVLQILDQLRSVRDDSAELHNALIKTTELLAKAALGEQPGKVRADLSSRYRDQIAKPVAGAATSTSDDVNLPPLRHLYVNPAYRILTSAMTPEGSERIAEAGWRAVRRSTDLQAMVLEHLLSTEATRVPLMLLGQPGAGKSVFTQMLAAELDPRDFLVIRVELRSVPADAGIQEQIEASLASLTGRSIRWPELAEVADGAQPVIILDGFDELLQASGISHFDFLERVQAFQERESELNRPVAALVTSRTAVASQVRYPVGTVVARVEEFDENQIRSWLSVWNQANPGRPLDAEVALRQGELASQPLLLFLLALFHSGGGDLGSGISQALLFERLFRSFVERDVAKLDAHLTDRDQQRSVQRDLDNLSMVAFAMFNRGRQFVTEADLISDLSALQSEQTGQSGPLNRAAALTIADRMAGRFFFRLFVHRDQSVRGQREMLNTYEFLHASFQEFLIARWVVEEVSRLTEHARRNAEDPYAQAPDDARLYALLSATALSTREQRILGFMKDLLVQKSIDDLAEFRVLVTTLFRGYLRPRPHDRYPNYRPMGGSVPTSIAAYSANLTLILLTIADCVAEISDEGGYAIIPVAQLQVPGKQAAGSAGLDDFYAVTRLWHSQLTSAEWISLLNIVRLHPGNSSGDSEAGYVISSWVNRSDPYPSFDGIVAGIPAANISPRTVEIPLDGPAGLAFKEARLLGITSYENACATTLPYLEALSFPGDADVFDDPAKAALMLAAFIPPPYATEIQRPTGYKALFTSTPGLLAARLLLGGYRDQMRHLCVADSLEVAFVSRKYSWLNITAYLDILAYINESADDPSGEMAEKLADLHGNILSHIGLSDEMEVSGSELYSLVGLARIIFECGASSCIWSGGSHLYERLSELFLLVDLLGPTGSMRKLFDLHYEEKRQVEVDEWIDSRRVFEDISVILRLALWVATIEHHLPVEAFPAALGEADSRKLEEIAPEFAARIRQVALDHGFLSPLS